MLYRCSSSRGSWLPDVCWSSGYNSRTSGRRWKGSHSTWTTTNPNTHTYTQSSNTVMISYFSKFRASASPVKTEWTTRCGWPLGCAGATCLCTGGLLGVGRGQRSLVCQCAPPAPRSPAGCTLIALPHAAGHLLPKSRSSWTGLPVEQTNCQYLIKVGTWQVRKVSCCLRFILLQLDF